MLLHHLPMHPDFYLTCGVVLFKLFSPTITTVGTSFVKNLGQMFMSMAGHRPPDIKPRMNPIEHSNILLEGIRRLMANEKLCDVVLISGIDGRRFPTSRFVLSIYSTYFEKMFTGSLRESMQKEIVLHGISGVVLEKVLPVFYTGTINDLNEDCIADVLETVCLWQLPLAEKICCDYLDNVMDKKNCLAIQLLAEQLDLQDLLATTEQFIYENFLEVLENDEFFEMEAERLFNLLSNVNLNVTCEKDVLKAAIKWVEYDVVNRSGFIAKLLETVDLSLLPVTFLTKNFELLCHSNAARVQTMNALRSQFHAMKTNHLNKAPESFRRKSTTRLLAVSDKDGLKMEVYNPKMDVWHELMNNNSRAYTVIGVEIVNGKLFVVGSPDSSKFISIECFDLRTLIWGFWGTSYNLQCDESTVAFMDGTAFIIGDNKVVECYDLLNRARGLPNLPPMTVARKFPGAVALDEKLYIMGGLINYPYGRCTETTFVEYFSFEKKKWFQCAAMLHSRSSFGVGVLHGCIFVLGGSINDYHFATTNTVEKYDPQSDIWIFIASLPQPCHSIGVAALNDSLIAVGGFADDKKEAKKTVYKYVEDANEWRELCSTLSCCSRSCVAAVKNDYFLE